MTIEAPVRVPHSIYPVSLDATIQAATEILENPNHIKDKMIDELHSSQPDLFKMFTDINENETLPIDEKNKILRGILFGYFYFSTEAQINDEPVPQINIHVAHALKERIGIDEDPEILSAKKAELLEELKGENERPI